MIDTDNVAHFCTITPDNQSIEKCKRMRLETDWTVDSVYLDKYIAVLIILVGGDANTQPSVLYFNYYFDREIMTWYDRNDFVPGKKFLIDRMGNRNYFLYEFQERGIKVFDLEFRSFYKIEGHKLNDARTIELYLEGHLINLTKVHPLVYGEVLNFHVDRDIQVVRDPLTQAVYSTLGFVGANLNFESSSDKVIYYFNFHNLKFNMIKDVNTFLKYNPGKDVSEAQALGDFLDFFVDPNMNLFITTGKEIARGKLFHDYISFTCEEFNSKIFNIPEEFQFEKKNFISRMLVGSEIIFLLKEPYRVFSYNKLSNEFFDYEAPSFMRDEGISNCQVKETVLFCIHSKADGFKVPFFGRIGTHRIIQLPKLNRAILENLGPIRGFKNAGRKWSRVEVVNFENYNSNPYKFDFVVNLIYDETLVTRAVTFTTDFLTRNEAGEKDPFLVSFKPHRFFDFSGDIKLGAVVYNLSGFYVMFTLKPRFEMIGLNSQERIDFKYIDASEILLKYRNPVYNLVVFVYRDFEDKKVYFIIYNVTIMEERQVIRHEEMRHFSRSMRVNVAQMRNGSLLIVIYDYIHRMVFKSYNYNIVTKMIARRTDNVTVNNKKIPLALNENEAVEKNNYTIKRPLVIDLKGQDRGKISLKIRDYITIEGNVVNMTKPEGSLPEDLDGLVRFNDYIYPKTTPTFIGLAERLKKKHIKILFNSRYMVGNFDDPNKYDIYLRSTMRRFTKLTFEFESRFRFCQEILVSDRHFFCLYTKFNKFYIKAKRLNQDKTLLFNVEIQEIQRDFKVLRDDDEVLMFVSKFKHNHAVRVEVIVKKTLRYHFKNLQPQDFGVANMNLVSVNFDFDRDNHILTIVGYSNFRNLLLVYTGKISFGPFGVQKVRTLKDSFDMNHVDVNISRVDCKSKL